MSDRKKVDRLILTIVGIDSLDMRINVNIPTYFKVNEEKVWEVLLKELIKQEKLATSGDS